MAYSRGNKWNKDIYKMAKSKLIFQVPSVFVYCDKRNKHIT